MRNLKLTEDDDLLRVTQLGIRGPRQRLSRKTHKSNKKLRAKLSYEKAEPERPVAPLMEKEPMAVLRAFGLLSISSGELLRSSKQRKAV